MLRMLLAIYLLKRSHARTLLTPRELELGWPFVPNNSTDHTEFAPWLRTVSLFVLAKWYRKD